MRIRFLGEPTVVQDNPLSPHNYFAWPSIAKLQDGRIAVVSSGFRLGHTCPFGKVVISFSDDNGKTYSRPTPVIDTPMDDRDAGVTAFGENSLVITTFNNTIREYREWNADDPYSLAYLDLLSADVESAFLGASFRFSFDGGKTFGKLYRSPVTSPHGIAVLQGGSLLWVGTEFQGKDLHAYRVQTDGTMEKLGTILTDHKTEYCEPHTVELPDGTLLCHFRAEGKGLFTLYQTKSVDSGKTWTAPQRLLPDTGGAPAHLLRHSSGVLLSAYGYRTAPYGVRVMYSTDDGETWDTDHVLYDRAADDDCGYPASVELDDGSILTVFYAHTQENTPAIILQQRWMIEE